MMNDPLGVQSAVLGMLSLSQGHHQPPTMVYPQNGDIFHHATAESFLKHYSQQQSHQHKPSNQQTSHQSGLPLTPPGSPEEKKLVISNSTPPSETKSCEIGRLYSEPNGFQNIAQAYSLNATSFQTNAPAQHMQLQDCESYGSSGGVMDLPSGSAAAGSFSPIGPSASQLLEHPMLARALQTTSGGRRSRSEKRPIPTEQKDIKYFERRKRNNVAAKKSRDQRKSREEEIAMRAAYLERENAVIRAQVSTLREEAQNLRALILQKRQRQMQMCGPPNLMQ